MSLRNKILLALGLCILSCVGSYFIISKIFDNLEQQLYDKCVIEAQTGARVMYEIMLFMTRERVLTEDDLFDTAYQEIRDTNPKKYHTRYDRTFDAWLQGIQDEFLLDEDVDYAILIDRNGYVPTHNSKYSQPETKQYATDLVNSRSKRIFADNPGIRDVINYRGDRTVRVLYQRDTGQRMWNIGAPIRINGKHWGAFMIGVSLDRIEKIKNNMLLLISVTMSVIFGTTLLAILAIIPRRYYPSDIDAPKY